MARPVLVLNIVGLTCDMIEHHTLHLRQLAHEGFMRPMGGVLPAVTCTAQATMLTGSLPREHGIVANGWFFRDLAEIFFWRQSNHLVLGEKLYEAARQRDPSHTTAKLFWWYNMYARVAYSVTPRPSYPADGRKIPDCYTHPPELRDYLQAKLGPFPLFSFWGPAADITSTRWITQASLEVISKYRPTLALVYLPHLDYNLQRLGPDDPRIVEDIRLVDQEAGLLIQKARALGMEIVVVSEYAITAVDTPISINRLLRERQWLVVRQEPTGWETLDAGASRAFAVADHQVAHVYVRDPQDIPNIQRFLQAQPGVEMVLNREQQRAYGLDNPRSGELVAVAAPGAWFTYYYWLEDHRAPDFARTVDIHRKPGYDPVELFLDPLLCCPKLRLGWRLLQRRLGFRALLDIISLDPTLVRGSHGRLPTQGKETQENPVFVCSSRRIERDTIPMTDVKSLLLELQFEG